MKKFVVAYDHIQKGLVIIPLIQYRPQRKIQEYRSRYEPVDSADTVLSATWIKRAPEGSCNCKYVSVTYQPRKTGPAGSAVHKYIAGCMDWKSCMAGVIYILVSRLSDSQFGC